LRNILQIINDAQNSLGLPASTTIFGTTGFDATGVQMGALANIVLDEFRRMNRWTILQFEYNLTVPVPITTTGNMASTSGVITNIAAGTTGITAGAFMVSGAGIPQAARVKSVDSPTQVTLTMQNTNTAALTGTSLIFSQDTFPMPVGFDWWQNRTMWDRTNRWELLGPDSPQMDQWHRSGIVVTGPRRHFRQIGMDQFSNTNANQWRIWPQPSEITSPLQLVWEYLSNAAVAVAGGTTYAVKFTGDTDQPLLDDQAIQLGVMYKFFEIKGFGSYITMKNDWLDYCNRLSARDGAAGTLQLAKRMNPIFLSPSNVQDGFFPGPSGPNTG
jgi:hypothetical protein